jgi:tRNA(Ile)-lysidine synthase
LALKSWAAERGLRWIATGHHQDDQAETILMRLARGAGIDGLTGIRPRRQLAEGVYVVRPLLGWRRSELIAIASAAGVDPVDDPTNRSPAHDRTHFRALVQASDLLQPARIAAAARNLAAVQEVVLWAEAGAGDTAVAWDADGCRIDARLLPPELERRLLVRAIEQLRQSHGLAGSWRSDKLPGVMAAAAGQGQATIAGILLRQESPQAWRLTREPPRRS